MSTPNEIEIAIHYHVCPNQHPRLHAPAVRSACEDMVKAGILMRTDDGYASNEDAMCAYINALRAVPFPIMKWVIPSPL